MDAPQGQVPTAPEGQAVAPQAGADNQNNQAANGQGQAPAATPAAGSPDANKDWDGDVNKLPPELQAWAKKVQSGFTKRWMDEAEVRRLGQEYQQLQSSEDWKSFQDFRTKGVPPQAARPQEAKPQPLITSQEWEEAQLDPSGEKINSLVEKVVEQKIKAAVSLYGNEIQQLRTTQQATAFQTELSDFTNANPDAVELHQMGILKPYMEEELRSGKHKTYASAIQASYERACKIRDEIYNKAQTKAQSRINEKKNAAILPGVNAGKDDVVLVDRKEDVFNMAFENALQKKKVKVRSK